MTMNGSQHQQRSALDRLAEAGRRALPDVDPMTAERHLAAMREVRLAGPVRQPMRRGLPRRRSAMVLVAAAALAVPSMALADVLPDPVQRAVSRVAAVIGLDLSRPSVDPVPVPEVDHVATPTDSTPADVPAEQGEGRGRPEPGEERGNRFGQVPEGPDQGRANPPRGTGRPDKSVGVGNRPVQPPKAPGQVQAPARPAAPAAASAPVAPKPARPAAPAAPPTPTPPAGGNGKGDGGQRAGQVGRR